MSVPGFAVVTVGSVVRVGLRLSLSPERCHAGTEVPRITAGFDQTTMVDASDNAELIGVGSTIPLQAAVPSSPIFVSSQNEDTSATVRAAARWSPAPDRPAADFPRSPSCLPAAASGHDRSVPTAALYLWSL